MPGHNVAQIDASQIAFNHAAAEQLREVQRMQKRRELFEETMMPEVSSIAASSGPSAGVASFAAAWRRNSCASSKEPQRPSTATQEVPQRATASEALYCMETDLNSALSIDVQDNGDLGDSDLEMLAELGSLPHSDEEDQVIDQDDDAGASVPGCGIGDALLEQPPASPCHGGA